MEQNLFALLRLALGEIFLQETVDNFFSFVDWEKVYSLASKLSVVGIAYAGVCKLPKDRRPPLDLAFQWASEAEAIRGSKEISS